MKAILEGEIGHPNLVLPNIYPISTSVIQVMSDAFSSIPVIEASSVSADVMQRYNALSLGQSGCVIYFLYLI